MRLARAAVGCLLVVPACVQAAPAVAAPHVAAHQETVALLASATVRDGPAPRRQGRGARSPPSGR